MMKFERTKHYYNAVTDYRKALRRIWSEFDEKTRRLERYAGSEGYEADIAKAAQERDEAIKALQYEARQRFDGILEGMRESAQKRPMVPPTQDQLALLSALKMREKVTRDELEQAGNTLKDSPVCLSVLEEIAEKNEVYSLRFSKVSTSGILKNIESLTESARRICKLNKCDSRGEMSARASRYSPDYDPQAFYSFRIDKDVEDVREAMRYFGGVENMDVFAEAVNQ